MATTTKNIDFNLKYTVKILAWLNGAVKKSGWPKLKCRA